MVTHTWNLCSAFKPIQVHTHTAVSSEQTHTHREHTPGAVGSHLRCCGARGAVGGSGGESAGHSLPPPTIPAGPETRTRDLWVTSPTLYPLGYDCPR